MPREKEGFRDNLARINELMPEKELLTKKDAAKVLGLSYNTTIKYLRFNAHGVISKADLARQISV